MNKKVYLSVTVAGILAVCALTACGRGGEDTAGSVFEKTEQSQPQASEPEAAAVQNAAETSSEEKESPASSLYEDFKSGNAKARYTGAGDKAAYIELSAVLTPGESYTYAEICEKAGLIDDFVEYKADGDGVFSYIDCGMDGDKELLVQQEFTADEMYETFTLCMIIKDMDGELQICWDQDMWSRSEISVNEDGTIEGSGSGGASVHYYDKAFVDAEGEYHYYYGIESTISPIDDYYGCVGGSYTGVSMEGLDSEHLEFDAYYFDSVTERRDDYTTYCVLDDQYNDITTDADFEEDNKVVKRFKESGINIYTSSEINDILEKRAEEIGYPLGN